MSAANAARFIARSITETERSISLLDAVDGMRAAQCRGQLHGALECLRRAAQSLASAQSSTMQAVTDEGSSRGK